MHEILIGREKIERTRETISIVGLNRGRQGENQSVSISSMTKDRLSEFKRLVSSIVVQTEQ